MTHLISGFCSAKEVQDEGRDDDGLGCSCTGRGGQIDSARGTPWFVCCGPVSARCRMRASLARDPRRPRPKPIPRRKHRKAWAGGGAADHAVADPSGAKMLPWPRSPSAVPARRSRPRNRNLPHPDEDRPLCSRPSNRFPAMTACPRVSMWSSSAAASRAWLPASFLAQKAFVALLEKGLISARAIRPQLGLVPPAEPRFAGLPLMAAQHGALGQPAGRHRRRSRLPPQRTDLCDQERGGARRLGEMGRVGAELSRCTAAF